MPRVIQNWLGREQEWRPGLDPKVCDILAFTTLPGGLAQLVSLGLPNKPEETQTQPVFSEHYLGLICGPRRVLTGHVYVTRGFRIVESNLILPHDSPHAVVARVANGITDATLWAELFAGIGSWSWAASRMGVKVGIAVECNDDVSDTFRLNHPEVPCFTGEVQNYGWVAQLSEPLQGIAASPPCPAFSSLQQSPGLAAPSASSWTQLMSVVRTLQVPMLLIENVKGILKRLPEVVEALRLCGYRLIATQLTDLADFSATQRSRWFGLLVRMHVNDRTPLATSEFKRHAHNLTSFQAVLPQDWPKDHLQIPSEGFLALRNPDYVKYATNEGQAWLKHLVHEFQQAPTFTHQYGNSWNLPRHTLMQGGLHCPVFCPRDSPQLARMFSPWEIARLHIMPHDLILPEDLLMCWQVLGNGVSPAQCTIGLGLALSLLGKATFKSVCEIIDSFIHDAVTFPGNRPVFREGWQRLETRPVPALGPVALQPETPTEVPSSPEGASDDSARCFCGDDNGTDPMVASPLPHDLQADYEVFEDTSSEYGQHLQEVSTPELTTEEWNEHSALFTKLEALEQAALPSKGFMRAQIDVNPRTSQHRDMIHATPQDFQQSGRVHELQRVPITGSTDGDITPTIKWFPKGLDVDPLSVCAIGAANICCEAMAPKKTSAKTLPKSEKQQSASPCDSSGTPASGTLPSPTTPDEAFPDHGAPLQRRPCKECGRSASSRRTRKTRSFGCTRAARLPSSSSSWRTRTRGRPSLSASATRRWPRTRWAMRSPRRPHGSWWSIVNSTGMDPGQPSGWSGISSNALWSLPSLLQRGNAPMGRKRSSPHRCSEPVLPTSISFLSLVGRGARSYGQKTSWSADSAGNSRQMPCTFGYLAIARLTENNCTTRTSCTRAMTSVQLQCRKPSLFFRDWYQTCRCQTL